MKLLFAVFLVYCGEQHAAGVDAHHRARRKVHDCDRGLSDQLLRLIVRVNAGEDDAILACAVVQRELEELLALLHSLARLDLDGAEV